MARFWITPAVFVGCLLGFGLVFAADTDAQNAAAPEAVPPAGWPLAFDEPFDRLDLFVQGSGRWEPHYPDGWRTNVGNQELEYYIDPRPNGDPAVLAPLHPFLLKDGILSVRAERVPEGALRATGGYRYASGMLTTYRSFSFQYGYVEMRARVPRGRGLWPALWLLAAAKGWPPEIDVMEAYGDQLQTLYVTLHTNESGRHRQAQGKVPVPDMSADFHVYGMKWTADEITWYFDGRRVFAAPTPADMHQRMFLLVNLAVGGTYAGSPDAQTKFPALFEVDWIRVFAPPAEQKATGR